MVDDDVDAAFAFGCRHAETLPWRIPAFADKHNLDDETRCFDSGQGRGKIAFHKGFVFPPCCEASAQTVRARGLAKALGRAEELLKVTNGS